MTTTTGLRANMVQVSLLVLMAALIGGMVGQERTVVPLLAEQVFGLRAYAFALAFIAAFGAVKAVTNLAAGSLADRLGRRPVLLAGWVIGLPVPFLLMWAPSWGWVVAANVLLGVNQGLTWSMALIMKIDLAGPHRRGLVAGLNEAAGYGGLALTAWGTGYLAARHGLQPAPFLLGAAYAALGILFTWTAIGETRPDRPRRETRPFWAAFRASTLDDPTLSASAQAGFFTNFKDAAAWGIFPIVFARAGLSGAAIGLLVAVYPAVWGLGQLVTGPLSDRLGRKPLIVWGMALQAVGLASVAIRPEVSWWLLGSVLLGLGTALAYPTLLAAVGDAAPAEWRASALGVYRFWRDLGLAAGAVLLGAGADLLGLEAAIWAAAVVTALSGWAVQMRMDEPLGRLMDGVVP